MEPQVNTLYLVCAALGGTILVVQTILLVVGFGGDTDTDVHDFHDAGLSHDGGVPHDHAGGHHGGDHHDHGHHHGDSFLKLLSFKTLVAFVTFFGLTGLACSHSGFTQVPTLLIALGGGSLALYVVAYLMTLLSRLQSQGNLDLRNAIGGTAKVYLRVPGERSGLGKVLVAVQGRKVECKAVTAGPEIPTGAQVRIVAINPPDTAEVLLLGKE